MLLVLLLNVDIVGVVGVVATVVIVVGGLMRLFIQIVLLGMVVWWVNAHIGLNIGVVVLLLIVILILIVIVMVIITNL